MKEYRVYKEASLKASMVNGKTALVRKIDAKYVDEFGLTNLERLLKGNPALNPVTGEAYELHHVGQRMDSTLAILSKSEHMQGGNNSILHEIGKLSEIDRNKFINEKREFWKALGKMIKEKGV